MCGGPTDSSQPGRPGSREEMAVELDYSSVVFLPRATPANSDIPKVLQPQKAARSSVDQVFNQGLWWGKQFILRP